MAKHLQHTGSGRVYPYTDALAKRGDMRPYDMPEPEAPEFERGEGEANPPTDEDGGPDSETETGNESEGDADPGDENGEGETDETTEPQGQVKPVSRMNKDELEAYAQANHGVDLDKRKSISDLKAEVRSLEKGE